MAFLRDDKFICVYCPEIDEKVVMVFRVGSIISATLYYTEKYELYGFDLVKELTTVMSKSTAKKVVELGTAKRGPYEKALNYLNNNHGDLFDHIEIHYLKIKGMPISIQLARKYVKGAGKVIKEKGCYEFPDEVFDQDHKKRDLITKILKDIANTINNINGGRFNGFTEQDR